MRYSVVTPLADSFLLLAVVHGPVAVIILVVMSVAHWRALAPSRVDRGIGVVAVAARVSVGEASGNGAVAEAITISVGARGQKRAGRALGTSGTVWTCQSLGAWGSLRPLRADCPRKTLQPSLAGWSGRSLRASRPRRYYVACRRKAAEPKNEFLLGVITERSVVGHTGSHVQVAAHRVQVEWSGSSIAKEALLADCSNRPIFFERPYCRKPVQRPLAHRECQGAHWTDGSCVGL